MSSFKNYITEGVANAQHTLKFFEYEHAEHEAYAESIREQLIREWGVLSDAIHPAQMNPLNTRKRPPLNKLVVDVAKVKVGRFGKFVFVTPSILIGAAYSKDERVAYKRKSFEIAIKLLQKAADKLNRTQKGSPFVVEQEDSTVGDVRLKFVTGEFTKTIFLISVEENYKYERIYFRDYLVKKEF
jgi:hypothetical protein